MEVKHYLQILRRYIWLILGVTLITSLCTALVSVQYLPRVYQASVKLLINSEGKGNGVDISSINTNLKLIKTYSEILRTSAVLEKVAAAYPEFMLTPEQMAEMLEVKQSSDSQVMTLVIRDTDYRRAAETVNAISYTFQKEIESVMKVSNITVLGLANSEKAARPILPNTQLNVIVSVLVTILLGVGFAFLHHLLQNTVKNDKDVEELLGLSVLAAIPTVKSKDTALQLSPSGRKVGEIPYATAKQ
ncbi:capsular polysaccharide biosynthesis protein [Paenibacillus mucilaginosus]|uniref:YveK family protein n=1 Tax=Paenibacillus mucilaginosus TaxID=61624 RepID=UPI003D1E2B74